MGNSLSSRVEREKELHNRGMDRSKYAACLGHAQSGYAPDRLNMRRAFLMADCKAKDVLEIGSCSWSSWVDLEHYRPKSLTCINISEKELEKGHCLYEKTANKIPEHKFLLMDAHHLDFVDNSFDVVFGSGILHHLNFEMAIREIHRVLKNDGKIIFVEPLGLNPVGKIVRKYSPNARTPDEKPLGREEVKILEKYFHLDNSYYQLFYVPSGVLSRFLFKSSYNPLTFLADKIDRFIAEIICSKTSFLFSLALYFRCILIYGRRKVLAARY